MSDQKPSKLLDDGYVSVQSVTDVKLDRLRDLLSRKHWNFDRASKAFDGYSEGVCILAGIAPELSYVDNSEYGPALLPGVLELYNFKRPLSSSDFWQLRFSLVERLDHLKAIGLSGLKSSSQALSACRKYDLLPPWFPAANDDVACAVRIPAGMRTNDEIRLCIKQNAVRSGGRTRAKKNAKTQLIQTLGRQKYESLKDSGFAECLAANSRRPVATKISDQVYFAIADGCPDNDPALPSITAVQENVRRWLKE